MKEKIAAGPVFLDNSLQPGQLAGGTGSSKNVPILPQQILKDKVSIIYEENEEEKSKSKFLI
jgi:hypothetical protein